MPKPTPPSGPHPSPEATAQASNADAARRLTRRRQAEAMIQHARHFTPADRHLVTWVYRDGRSVCDYAQQHRITRSVADGRLHRLVARVHSPAFQYIAHHLFTLPRHLRVTARMRFLEGRSLRDIARRRRLSLHALRQQVEVLDRMVQLAVYKR